MPKTRAQKKQILDSLTDKLNKAKSVVFVNFQGLKVKEAEELRRSCRQEQVELCVAKKTLIDLALQSKNLPESYAKQLPGEVAVVMGYEDEIAPARLLKNFGKDHEAVKMVAGIFDGKALDAVSLKQLADLPGKTELLAKLVGTIQSPLSGLANVLQGNLRSLVYVLNAVKDKKSA
jgi:large subunit ribosomal protein L10